LQPPNERTAQFEKMIPNTLRALLERLQPPHKDDLCDVCQLKGIETPLPNFSARFSCEDCIPSPAFCTECVKKWHHFTPFHRLLEWKTQKQTWLNTTLCNLGDIIVIGHPDGSKCAATSQETPLTIIHEHGFCVDYKVCYCKCRGGAETLQRPLRLLEHGIFPGSWSNNVGTAYTLNALKILDANLVQAQSSMHDLFIVLTRLTDEIARLDTLDRARQLLTAMREYNFLMTCMRHGVVPEAGKPLERNTLALACPLCPQPGINMRPGYQNRDKKYQCVLRTCGRTPLTSRARYLDTPYIRKTPTC
ncbi:uncharacterized protein BXZ73DRAFT_59074, partial [Epithele typhae]|uniref:uncharacterized protein n=1 Tax=Epithele typhae TaxID=378194 RepID=UPI0020078368